MVTVMATYSANSTETCRMGGGTWHTLRHRQWAWDSFKEHTP